MSVSCVKGTSVEVWNAILPFFHLHLLASLPLSSFPPHSVALCLSALWKWKMELVINFPTCGTSEKQWQFWLNDFDSFLLFSLLFLSRLNLFCFLLFSLSLSFSSLTHITLSQKADVRVEEVSGCVQPRGTMWAHPPNPQSPRVHLQVHRPLAHALFPVSVCVPFYGLIIMIMTSNFFLNPQWCK